MTEPTMGISGKIAKNFLLSEITPLLGLVGLLLGLFAITVTPREEEPQINVTFANVFIAYPGASPSEVEHIVSGPAEQVLSEITGIDHIYSSSYPGLSVLTVQFKVGQDRTAALVRLYNKLASNTDWLPQGLGISQPLVKPKGIDDVPIVSATLWSDDPSKTEAELLKVAHALEAELKRVNGTRDIYTIGGHASTVNVTLQPEKLAAFNISAGDIRRSLQIANTAKNITSVVTDNQVLQIQPGTLLSTVDDISELVVGSVNEHLVYLSDIATVEVSSGYPEQYVEHRSNVSREEPVQAQAVTIAIAKKPGSNAVEVANKVIERFEQLEGIFIPDDVHVEVTRNYGKTADSKANKLVTKLIFATLSVVILVIIAMGLKEALIVGIAVIITLMLTLFASWAWGFTLNRVSLFALIFSIGILVDDAIVVVENIHRHMHLGGKKLLEVIPLAVDEVGGPTILATFTVIAALLPMAFVTGLMGPYMSPIPINASMGMIISLAVAYVLTPWMTYKVLKNTSFDHADGEQASPWIDRLFNRLIGPFLGARKKSRLLLLIAIAVLITLASSLAAFKIVVLKMLPFDNKSEFQIVVDMPEGTTLEQTRRVLGDIADVVEQVPEVLNQQLYAGTAAPINFNGLVRQYYLRKDNHLGDIQVNLVDKHERKRKSHQVALDVRSQLSALNSVYPMAKIKVIEVPPGPPVMSPLVAEIYGLDYDKQQQVAEQVKQVLRGVDDIVDIDDSTEFPSARLVFAIDRKKAALLGLDQSSIIEAIHGLTEGSDVTYLHSKNSKYAVPVRIGLSTADKADIDTILAIKVRNNKGQLVSISEVVKVIQSTREPVIHHKDSLPVVYVTADMVGELDSPLYGMFEAVGDIKQIHIEGAGTVKQFFASVPENPYDFGLKWGGEWKVTYETFRDMGIAYAVGMILIYLLVVAQFRSYLVPLVIMAPIPLTIIGVMPGHALLGAQFTATSMIGMIALAGIIVRNSILLVDFINDQLGSGMPLDEAVISASTVRAKPIILTGLAAMMGAFFILDDPIFSGLAIALIFGILVSTLLTLVVIPVLYYLYLRRFGHSNSL